MLTNAQLYIIHNFAHATNTEHLSMELAQEHLRTLLSELAPTLDDYAYDLSNAENKPWSAQSEEVRETIHRKILQSREEATFIGRLDERKR